MLEKCNQKKTMLEITFNNLNFQVLLTKPPYNPKDYLALQSTSIQPQTKFITLSSNLWIFVSWNKQISTLSNFKNCNKSSSMRISSLLSPLHYQFKPHSIFFSPIQTLSATFKFLSTLKIVYYICCLVDILYGEKKNGPKD